MIYSRVSFVGCNDELFSADVTFNFSTTYHSLALFGNHYSAYQSYFHEIITEQRDKGKTFDQIAVGLNKKGYLSVSGKKLKGNHVHSIVKKKRLKDGKLERQYPEDWSDFS